LHNVSQAKQSGPGRGRANSRREVVWNRPEELLSMKTKSSAKKAGRRRVLATAGKQKPAGRRKAEVIRLLPVASLDFSSGLDETRALAVEESLDERERRG
jgi:hypothetical protein